MKMQTPSWVTLQQLVGQLEATTDMRLVDDISRRVFEWVYARSLESAAPIFVQTVVMQSDVASPATIHKCLSVLEREGFIRVDVDPSDARRRIVSPTEHAHKLIKELSKAVTQWAAQSTSLAKSASRERSPR